MTFILHAAEHGKGKVSFCPVYLTVLDFVLFCASDCPIICQQSSSTTTTPGTFSTLEVGRYTFSTLEVGRYIENIVTYRR